MIIQMVKPLDHFGIRNLILGHIAKHLTPCHFAHGALLNDLAVFFLTKHAGDKANIVFQIFGNTDTVFFGRQIDDAVCLSENMLCNFIIPMVTI